MIKVGVDMTIGVGVGDIFRFMPWVSMSCLYYDSEYVVLDVNVYGGVRYLDDKSDCKCVRCITVFNKHVKITNVRYIDVVQKRIVGIRDNKLNSLGI